MDPEGAEVGGGRRRAKLRAVLPWVVGVPAALVVIGWVGLRVEPSPLDDADLVGGAVPTVAVPDGLPAPVERFYRVLYGDAIPVVDTAVISGRGTMRINGITLPVRFRFSHDVGNAYRHYIETTVFGARFLTVDERYVDGVARLELPFGVSEGPEVDQGANLALWAEAVWMPSAWVLDDRVRWEEVDATTAALIVPFDDGSERFTVHFDPDSGLLQRMESMRFKGESSATRTLWVNEVVAWGEIDGEPVPVETAVSWGDEGSPWAVLRTEDVVRNAALGSYLAESGP